MTMTLSSPTLYNTSAVQEDATDESATAFLLSRFHSALVDRWIVLMRAYPGSNYTRRPHEELQSTCSECLTAYQILLSEGDTEPLWKFIERICALRASMEFPPSEITEAFMLSLDAVDAVLGPEIDDRDDWARIMGDLRGCVRVSLKALVNTYLLQLELS